MTSHRKSALLGALTALAVIGAVAVASNVTIPNTFAPNTPVKAAEMNANFSAVAAANNDNQAQITSLQNNTYTKTQTDARYTRLPKCYWTYKACGAAGGTSCAVTCNAGTYVMAGGCDANAGAPSRIVKSFPGPSSGNYGDQTTVWPFGAPISGTTTSYVDQWFCQVDTGFINSVYVFCCPGV
jgi:hypothetical protein